MEYMQIFLAKFICKVFKTPEKKLIHMKLPIMINKKKIDIISLINSFRFFYWFVLGLIDLQELRETKSAIQLHIDNSEH